GLARAPLVLGAVVTGSGPHAGDASAPRTGFDPATVAQLHTDVVMLLIGLSVGAWFVLRLTGAPAGPRAAAGWLLGVEAAQGVIGYVQYFSHLPVLLVAGHMLGACLVWICAVRLLLAMRSRSAAADPAGAAGGGARGDGGIDAAGVDRAGADPARAAPVGANPAEGDPAGAVPGEASLAGASLAGGDPAEADPAGVDPAAVGAAPAG